MQKCMTYSYDNLNRLVTVTDPNGVVITKYIYDPNGNVIKQIDAKGYLSGNNDDQRYGTLYTYDLANRLVKVVDPETVFVKIVDA
jgi:YD repeat-containing protein